MLQFIVIIVSNNWNKKTATTISIIQMQNKTYLQK